MLGERISDLDLPRERQGIGFGDHVSVKEAVLPFNRFEGADALLGPEMRSTGEVMGIARDFPTAFAKAQAAAGVPLPRGGTVFITVTDWSDRGDVARAGSTPAGAGARSDGREIRRAAVAHGIPCLTTLAAGIS